MKILLPVDGSAPALAAVQHTLRLCAQGLRASVVLINVQEPPTLYEVVRAHDAERINSLRQAAGADLLAEPERLLEAAGLDYESEVAGGDPAQLLLELLENYRCDAVVMGARGMGQPLAGGLGSVAHDVLLRAAVPVTLVRAAPTDPAANTETADDDDSPEP